MAHRSDLPEHIGPIVRRVMARITAAECRQRAAWYARIAQDCTVALRGRQGRERVLLSRKRRKAEHTAEAWALRAEALEGER